LRVVHRSQGLSLQLNNDGYSVAANSSDLGQIQTALNEVQ